MSHCKCPVTVKKFWGLERLKNDYDYIAAVDCECLFIRSFEPGKIMREIWETQSFLTANKSTHAQTISRHCAELAGLDSSRVRQETEDYLYYWWFNEIPVYRTDTLGGFFSWLGGGSRREAVFSNWCCFDYLRYVMWLIECGGFKLRKIDIEASYGITESLYRDDRPGIENQCGLHWTSRRNITLQDSKIVMRFHLDRLKNHSSLFRRLKNAAKYILRR